MSLEIQAPWGLEIAYRASIAYASGGARRQRYYRYGFWLLYACCAGGLLVSNRPISSTFVIGAADLSAVLNALIVLIILASAYGFAVLLKLAMVRAWKTHLLERLKPWPDTANGIRSYAIHDDAFHITTGASFHKYAWHVVSKVEYRDDFLFVMTGKNLIAAIPGSYFVDECAASIFLQELRGHIEASKPV